MEPTILPGGRTGRSRRPLRVLLVCDWFLKYTSDFAAALARGGHGVRLLCRSHALEFGGDLLEREQTLDRVRMAGVDVVELPARTREVGRRKLGALDEARRWAPDVVHAQSATYDPLLLAAFPRRKLFLTVHDPRPHLGARPQRRHRVLDWAWRRRADCIVVHSERLADGVSAKRPVVVLRHGTEVHVEADPVPRSPAVVFFGRLEPYKGISVLVEAMERVWKERPDVALRIHGAGSAATAIPTDPRIYADVRYVPEHELDRIFSRATLLVLPYLDASQSGVGSLALARGIPVVVSDVGGLPDLALDPSYVVPPGDADALAATILRHLDHDAALRQRVLEDARARFSWDAVAAAAVRAYRCVAEVDEGPR